jgi:hypothetical protein
LLREGSAEQECLNYVLHEEAGSNEKRFQGGLKRDCDKAGRLHPKRMFRDPVSRKKRGMCFEDFVRWVYPAP